MAWFSRKDKVAVTPAGVGSKSAPSTGVQRPSAPPGMDWVSIQGVGDHQKALGGTVPRAVHVELFPWEREQRVTARVGGQRVGELPSSIERSTYAALRARRSAGMPPVVLQGEIRRGDRVPVYLAVALPTVSQLASWAMSIAPEGWSLPRAKQEDVTLQGLHDYQEALATLHQKYGNAKRRPVASIEWTAAQGGKHDGEPLGLVSLDGIVFAEFRPRSPEKWRPLYEDHKAGTPGRLLVSFTKGSGGYGAWAVYKTPQPE